MVVDIEFKGKPRPVSVSSRPCYLAARSGCHETGRVRASSKAGEAPLVVLQAVKTIPAAAVTGRKRIKKNIHM